MAQKGKNENLKDTARNHQGGRRSKRNDTKGSVECGHSLGIKDYLLEDSKEYSIHGPPADDRLSNLRRLYKKTYGFKPVGMDESQIERALAERGVDAVSGSISISE